MLPGPADFAPVRISTNDLPERQRVAMWRDVVSRTLLHVDVEPLSDLPLEVEATLRALPGLRTVSSCVGSPYRMWRTQEHTHGTSHSVYSAGLASCELSGGCPFGPDRER